MIKTVDEYHKKLNLLKKYDESYYDLSNPKVSDSKYDALKKELLEFEEKNNKYKFVGSKVGYTPSKKFSKVKHLEKMLSLDNAFDLNDVKNFLKK
jgi:NAD-dependent DNA ligase (contains BRCT domain type II)